MRELFALTALVFIVIVIGNYVIVAQTPIIGEWRADARIGKKQSDEDMGKINVSFEIKTERGTNTNGQNYALDEMQGLTREQTENGRVNFRLVREAGTVDAEGSFTGGRGSGQFRFTPSPGYIEAMRSRGFDLETSTAKGKGTTGERLFTAATINVTTKLADELQAANFGQLDIDDLFKAAIFKFDSKFMSEMKATGFPDLTMEDLVKARIFKIDADYVRQVNEMGFTEKDFENLVKFRIFKVTPEFLGELKAEGFSNLSSEEIVKTRIFNVSADFIRKAKSENPNVTVEEIVRTKIGVRVKNVKDDN